MTANNVTRYLDAHKIKYTVFETPVAKLGANETAAWLGVALELIFKTIVVKRERGKPILAVVSGADEVDLKQLAAALGEKKVHLSSEKEAEALTGLQAGGISPLALLNKGFQVLIDSSAQNWAEIHISGGQRGLNIRLSPMDLAHLSGAHFAPIAHSDPPRT
ncbi:MAG: aminoacyl-tRNA deacylase [Anaerolineales bacterium]|jgi:Cys-tRNA(Pro)/Cys-tRNA(Cys) deacylase|nr:aminoacyl-tRNA deacylase [Anaerolineales bacterium]